MISFQVYNKTNDCKSTDFLQFATLAQSVVNIDVQALNLENWNPQLISCI